LTFGFLFENREYLIYFGGNKMKKGIHPNYELREVHCSCGNVIKTKTTAKNLNVEICAACHPFFTGAQKLVDTTGRVDRFNKRYGRKQEN
jgi:large subunit ribosomal protein L31